MRETVKIYTEQYNCLPGRFARKIEHDLHYILQKQIPGLRRIYLFGSAARGEVRSTSDIDLLIVTEKRMTDRKLAAEIRWTLDEDIDGVRTDLVYMNEQTKQEPSAFNRELERDKKLILEVQND